MSRFGAFPRTPALRSGCSGAMLFGGRKESFPQLRSPPRSGLLEYSVLPFVLWSFRVFCFVQSAFGVRPRTTPFLVFISAVCGVAFATRFRIARLRQHSSFSHGRPSGNVRGSNANALDPPSRSRASPLAEDKRDASGTP